MKLPTMLKNIGYAFYDELEPCEYDQAYFDRYAAYEGSEICTKLNEFRVGLAAKYAKSVIDIGIGSGEFLKQCKKAGLNVNGYDVNPAGVKWLKRRKIYIDPYIADWQWDAVCLWDVLEHIADPRILLSRIPAGAYAIITIPCFEKLEDIETSHHLRSTEHHHYYTRDGFVGFMARQKFVLIEESDKEVLIGREQVRSFVFKKLQSPSQPKS